MAALKVLTRRELLEAGGALVVTFGAAAALPGIAWGEAESVGLPRVKPVDRHAVDSFIAIDREGHLIIYSGKVDLGQGLRIAIPQMAAEELSMPIDRVTLIEGDTALTPDQGPTSGSSGVAKGGVEIRQAAATAREALLRLAGARFKVDPAQLKIEGGRIRPPEGGDGVAFAELLEGKSFDLAVDPKAPLKDHRQYTLVGLSLPRPDLPGKITGRHLFMQDFRLPGMLHARVIRPGAVGAHLLSVEEASIKDIPGARVVRLRDFLAVVAEDEWAAIRGAEALRVNWSEGSGLPGSDDLEVTVRGSAVASDEIQVAKGDPAKAFGAAPKKLTASYFWPIQSHASLGPSCAVADLRADEGRIWTASQATHKYRTAIAKMLELPAEKLRLIYLDGAGSYGMNGHEDAAADAALLSKMLGKPVRVQWSRADEHGWDPKGPPQLLDLRAGLDDQGRILSWETELWLPAATKDLPNVPLLAPEAAGIAQPEGLAAGLLAQNADPPYAVPDLKAVVHWLADTPLRASHIRAPGKIGNSFAIESFTDELAAAAKIDPVEFRLRGMQDSRAIEVLRLAAARFGWAPRASPNPAPGNGAYALGRGIAYVHYKQSENHVAMAMELAVERATGTIRIHRVICAHDCGLVINPDALTNQIEGCILQTLSRTLHEEVTFDRQRVTSTDWESYPILTFRQLPEIAVELVNRPLDQPMGGGEAAAAPVAAALGNALFDALGVRVRRVPVTPDRVLFAVKAADAARG